MRKPKWEKRIEIRSREFNRRRKSSGKVRAAARSEAIVHAGQESVAIYLEFRGDAGER
jgi:hypothetical protein